jgi:hypothetical protein
MATEPLWSLPYSKAGPLPERSWIKFSGCWTNCASKLPRKETHEISYRHQLVLQAAVYLWRIDAAYTADSVQGLAQLLENLPTDIEQTGPYIAKTLGEIGPPARSAVPTLRKYLRERHEPRPGEAAQALWRIDPNECEFTLPMLIEAAQDRRANRLLAVRALGAMGPKAKTALPVLQTLAKDEEEPLQAAVEQSINSVTRATEL